MEGDRTKLIKALKESTEDIEPELRARMTTRRRDGYDKPIDAKVRIARWIGKVLRKQA